MNASGCRSGHRPAAENRSKLKGWKPLLLLRLAGIAALTATLAAAPPALAQPTPRPAPAKPGAAPPAPAAAAPAAPGAANPPPPSWSTRCVAEERSSQLDCTIEQRVIVTNTGQLVASVQIRVPSDTKKPVMMIQGPLGLFVPAGITVDVNGGHAQKLDIQTCEAQGCYAGSPVPDAFLAAMMKEPKLNLTFQGMNKQPINLSLPLTGFPQAYAKIK
jgi:invasion protein IalB